MTPEQAQRAIDEDPPTQHEIAIALRDGFACAALTGLLADGGRQAHRAAELAYEYADAMMAARGPQ